jgi:hypothetical protein
MGITMLPDRIETPPEFEFELAGSTVIGQLKALGNDNFSNEKLISLMASEIIYDDSAVTKPGIINHVCATLTLNTPTVSQEYDDIVADCVELDVEIKTLRTQIRQLEKRIARTVFGELRDTLRNQLTDLNVLFTQKYNENYIKSFEKLQIVQRATICERTRAEKALRYHMRLIKNQTGITADNDIVNFDARLNHTTLRQIHDVIAVSTNLIKKIAWCSRITRNWILFN